MFRNILNHDSQGVVCVPLKRRHVVTGSALADIFIFILRVIGLFLGWPLFTSTGTGLYF